ncbi:MAG: hypothetical protein ACHQX1_00615 [Candidatus Micrarchaeales archaeon]
MIFVDELKWAFGVMLHPEQNTKKTMDSIEAFLMYYKASLIPVLIAIIIEVILGSLLWSSIISSIQPFVSSIPIIGSIIGPVIGAFAASIFVALLIAATILLVWIIIPLSVFLNSIIYHVVGKYIFRIFKNEFDTTASAFAYSVAPYAALAWTIAIPAINILVFIIAAGWQITILVYSLANQEEISKTKAGLLIFVLGIIASIVWLII